MIESTSSDPTSVPKWRGLPATFPMALVAAIAGAGSGFASESGSPASPGGDTPKTNVILVMADDLGYGDVGFLGNQVIQTPHLDAMAESGMVFTRFYAAAPVCSPTRGSCLTGRHPSRYGVNGANNGHLLAEEISLAEILNDRGYATGHFGKWHLGTLTKDFKDSNRGGPKNAEHFAPPWMNGFERCFSTEAKTPTYDPMWKPPGAGGRYWLPLKEDDERLSYGTRYFDESGEVVEDNLDGDDSRIIMDRAIPFIDAAVKSERAFFAVIWFHAPHRPVVASPAEHDRYAEHSPNERSYYGCISALDAQIGRLRERLRSLGVADDTMICFASDNGPEGQANDAPGSAGILRGRKRALFEGGVRVPAVIEWPARVAKGVTAFPAVTSDYLPTVLGALGIDPPDDRPIDGVTLLPALVDGESVRKAPIGFLSKKKRAWSDDRFKLISNDGGVTYALYDLIEDPAESQDLSGDHPKVVAEMIEAQNAWIASCNESGKGADYERTR